MIQQRSRVVNDQDPRNLGILRVATIVSARLATAKRLAEGSAGIAGAGPGLVRPTDYLISTVGDCGIDPGTLSIASSPVRMLMVLVL